MTNKKKSAFVFEKSLSDLESLVQKIESGDLSLEESLSAFEQGIRLTRECQGALEKAEQKVQLLLMGKNGEPQFQPFDQSTKEGECAS
ncbi:MAG: exodeoxyribonuclease VII small subunit [Candidatus Endonucleobacter bathymodioli]|uniref:Exodeoxyribonuclease 7 small subunit n=1 Tax=Candidatus Endonucleibacter bathymodioli TaxID=539814 RepID=A0AA90NUC5_9GAMM|nr:exodeoxyribonuclease VII small subunit [Candidatus Endonucleobacter bathymodioli]